MNKPTCTAPACERKVLARSLCSTHYSYWHRARNGRKTYSKACDFCRDPFTTRHAEARYCSELHAQWDLAGRSRSTDVVRFVKRRERPSPVHVRTASRMTSGQCKNCSTWFVSFHRDVTCSTKCRRTLDRETRRENEHRRRARERNAFVAPVYRRKVFEADGYRCYLCNKKVDPSKSVPHPKAPTIDHVIPLARGGTHEPLNVRTACFLCNSTKGDRGGWEQMMLVAI